jgi:hypothetical protein
MMPFQVLQGLTGMETLKTFRFGEVAKFVTISWQVATSTRSRLPRTDSTKKAAPISMRLMSFAVNSESAWPTF